MYSQQELDDAVTSGIITAEAANALRSYVQRQRTTDIPDEEQFRLLTGFNDIFVSIAAAILLFAVGWIGQNIGQTLRLTVGDDGPSFLAPLGIAAASWGLALYFTGRRRMALPSILLLLAFVGGVFLAVGFGLAEVIGEPRGESDQGLYAGIVAAVAGTLAAVAALVHWRRFRVPITIAAGTLSVSAIAVGLFIAALGDPAAFKNAILGFVLMLGVGVFLFAMWWDSSDRERITRRSDVAFWLHLLAAPMIAHPVFTLLGLNQGHIGVAGGLTVVALYIALGVTALAVDRRALLVSALAYVLFALQSLFREFGAVQLNIALTALIIGSALLLLSAFWHQARSTIVRPLPENLRNRLPVLDRPLATQSAA